MSFELTILQLFCVGNKDATFDFVSVTISRIDVNELFNR